MVNYAFQNYNKETMARSASVNSAISLKKSVETAKILKGKKVSTVIDMLDKIANAKTVVPFRKYRAEMGHKRGAGIDTGGYPLKVALEFSRLVKSAEKNAIEREISGDLYVLSISSRKGTQRYHNGRYAGRKMKSTSVEVIVGLKNKTKKEVSKK